MPTADAPAGEGEVALSAAGKPSGAEPRSRVASVLIIDDDPALSRMLRVAMISRGFSVRLAADGSEGLERVADDEPDVIVLDLQMPVMDGRAFYGALRERGNRTPVVILSAFGAKSAQAELGAEAYVTKPFNPDDLVRAVESLLRQ